MLAWALGAVAMPVAGWIWLRRGGPRRVLALVAFAGGFVAQAAWLYGIGEDGLGAVLGDDVGMGGWGAWSLGIAGSIALVAGFRGARAGGSDGLLQPDRAFEAAIGLFGLGVLLQQIARALA